MAPLKPSVLHLMMAIALLLESVVIGQQVFGCAELQIGDLGSSIAPSAQGLLAIAVAKAAEPENANLSVQVLQFNTVCLSQGSVRDRYTAVSVVVRYRRDGREDTAQVEYQCRNGEWISSPELRASLSPNATLSTALRTDCLACQPLRSTLYVTPEEHCAGEEDWV